MSDEADKAEIQEEMARQTAICTKRKEGPLFTGLCANCELEVEYPNRWCCKECRDDYDKREDRR
jgi:uncharacterized OB-fold protein